MSSIEEVKEVIDGLIKLQDKILKSEPWLHEEVEENIGNVAQIEIYSLYGTYSERLKLENGMRIVKTTEEPIHVIRMHIDTFIDLLSGELDFGEAYAKGLVEFDGLDYHVHSLMWSRAFKRLRKYISL